MKPVFIHHMQRMGHLVVCETSMTPRIGTRHRWVRVNGHVITRFPDIVHVSPIFMRSKRAQVHGR